MAAPSDISQLIANPDAVAQAMAFIEAFKNFRALTSWGEVPLQGPPRSANAVLDLRGLTPTGAPLPDSNTGLSARLTVVETMLSGASITAVCNGDGTITVTLTWGS